MKNLSLRRTVFALLAASSVLVSSQLVPAQEPPKKSAKETITVTAVIKKFDGTRDRVLSVYVQDDDHGKLLLSRGTTVGKELLRQVGAKVRATGYKKKSHSEPEFEFVLDVLEYDVIAPAPTRPAPAPKKKTKRS